MGSNPYAAKGLPKSVRLKDNSGSEEAKVAEKVEEKSSPEVPSGSIKEVLDWVDGDKEKAKVALDAEKDGAGRKTLVKELEELLDDDNS